MPVQRFGNTLVQVVVAIGGRGTAHRGTGQPVEAVIGEGVPAALHQVAIAVVTVGHATGIEKPVVVEADAVTVALAVGGDRGAVSARIVGVIQKPVGAVSFSIATQRLPKHRGSAESREQ